MELYGIVTDVSKKNFDVYANMELSNGHKINAKVPDKTLPGDMFKVKFVETGIEVKPFNVFSKKKIHSVKYGFVNEVNSNDGKTFGIREVVNGKILGSHEAGHCSSSTTGTMTGYGISNYDFYDETGKYTKALNTTGVEGNRIYGSNLLLGLSAEFFVEKVYNTEYVEMTEEELKKNISKGINENDFLINTVGIGGMLLLMGSYVYKITGSGSGAFAKFLAMQTVSPKGKPLQISLESLRERVEKIIPINTVKEFEIYLTSDEDSKDSDITSTDITIKLFGVSYKINSVKINHSEGIVEFYSKKHVEADEIKIHSNKYIFDIKELNFPHPFYINKDSGKMVIANQDLTIAATDLVLSVNSLKSLGKDNIILQVGKKGLLVDYSGTSNL